MDWTLEIAHYEAGIPNCRARLSTAASVGGALRFDVTEDADEASLDATTRWPMSDRAYLLLPGAVYAGNTFPMVRAGYPPIYPPDFPDSSDPVIVDLPRLPRIHLRASDLSMPLLELYEPETHQAQLLGFPVSTHLGETGIRLELHKGVLEVRLQFPAVRWQGRYAMGQTDAPSEDRGVRLAKGTRFDVGIQVRTASCEGVNTLFELLLDARDEWIPRTPKLPVRPCSATAELIVTDTMTRRWNEPWGYFSTSDSDHGIPFQPGWVGGAMGILPFLEEWGEEAATCAGRNLDFVAKHLQAPSGYLYGGFREGTVSDGFSAPHAEHWGMVRKSGDALLYAMRHLLAVPSDLRAKFLQRLAEAFARTWNLEGAWGQHVDVRDGRTVVRGSVSGGTAIGGLALAAQWFERPEYLSVAKRAAAAYGREAVASGLLVGGPGDMLKAPDSESAFGLLEGSIGLWEATGEVEWCQPAEAVAAQAASWVIPYDFAFPPTSTFGRMDMRSTGAVMANAQNKHGAPGICTGSALPLLKLFRATGNRRWLDLAVDVSHALPLFVSSADRPIASCEGRALPPGWMNERVNLSDWEAHFCPPGEVLPGSCWGTVSMLLTHLQMPGVYAQPETGLVACADHVEAVLVREVLHIANPTPHEATVRVLLDFDPSVPLGELWWRHADCMKVPAGGSTSLPFSRRGLA